MIGKRYITTTLVTVTEALAVPENTTVQKFMVAKEADTDDVDSSQFEFNHLKHK